MAGKRYSSNGGKIIAIGVTVVILGLIIALVAAIGSLGFTQKPKDWFNSWGQGVKDEIEPDVKGDPEPDKTIEYGKYGFLCVSNIEETDGIQMLSTTQEVDEELKDVLTVSVTPANADVFSVNWTSNNSAVVVTPIEGDIMSAKLTLVAPFETAVTITCNVVSATTLTATCTVDCLAAASDNIELHVSPLKFGAENTFTVTDSSPALGTVWGEFVIGDVTVNLTDDVITKIKRYAAPSLQSSDFTDTTLSKADNYLMLAKPRECFNASRTQFDDEGFRIFFAKAINELGGNSHCKVDTKVSYVYNGKVYGTYNVETYSTFDYSTYGVPATDATLDPDNPVLGT